MTHQNDYNFSANMLDELTRQGLDGKSVSGRLSF